MVSDRTRILCLAALVSVIGGCGGGGSSNDAAAEQAAADGAAGGVEAGDPSSSAEVTAAAETSGGIATGVPAVSSAQMGDFVGNPLASAIPTELNDGTVRGVSSDFITNPLMN